MLRPRRPRNFTLTVAACLLVAAAFLVASHHAPFNPGRGLGLAFGSLAAGLFVFEMAYPARRPRARPLGTAQAWIQAHVYLGVVAFVAVLAHSGFRLPHGAIGGLLLLLSGLTVLTGLGGVLLQKFVPARLCAGLQVEVVYERIPELVSALLVEADALVAEAGDVVARFYRGEVRPALARPRLSWVLLFDAGGGREQALEPFRRVLSLVDEPQKAIVQDLMALFQEKRELDAHWSLQGLLRRWLLLHVPIAGLMIGLMVVHIVSSFLY